MTHIVRHGKRPAPVVFASLYEPDLRRKWCWYSYRCGECGSYQLGRAATIEDATGRRRAGCGHWVTVMIARVYPGRQA